MKKILASIILISLTLILIFCIAISNINLNSTYEQLNGISKINFKNIDKNQVRLVKFPFPYLVVNQLSEPGKAEFKDLKISFSLLSILKFSPKISELEIDNATIYLQHDDVSLLKHDEFIAEIIQQDLLSIKTNISKLVMVESDQDIAMTLYDISLNKEGNKYVFEAQNKQEMAIEGTFEKQKDEVLLTLEQRSNNYHLIAHETYQDGTLKSGHVQLKSKDLPSRAVSLIPNINNIIDKFHNKEEIDITFDIKPIKNGLHFDNIKINSDSIIGVADFLIKKDNTKQSKINIYFDKIDLTGLLNNENSSQTNQTYSASTNWRVLQHTADITCQIKNIILDSKNAINNIVFKAQTTNNEMTLQRFAGSFSDQHQFEINGKLSENSFRSIFDGNIYLKHPNLQNFAQLFDYQEPNPKDVPFEFKSKLTFTPVYFAFQDFILKLDEMNVSGNYSKKLIGQQSRVNSDVRISSLNLSDKKSTPVISHLVNKIEQVFQGMKDKNYSNKFIPLRKIKSIGSYDISIDELSYMGHEYSNVNLGLELSPGRASINRLYLNNTKDWFDIDVELDAKSIIPNLIVKINDASLNVDFLSMSGLLSLQKKALEKIDLNKINFVSSGLISELKDGDKSIKRLTFSMKNDKNLLVIPSLDFDLLDGRIKMSGSTLLSPLTINFAYGLNGANLEKISQILPNGLMKTKGVMSSNGVFSTHGDSIDKLLYNFYTKSNIIMKGVHVNNFSPDEFISKINKKSYKIADIETDLNKMLLTGSTFITDLKSNLKMSKGILSFDSIAFKTKSTSTSGAANINIYKQNVDSIFNASFYIVHRKENKFTSNYKETDMQIKIKGDLFNPSKKALAEKVIETIATR
ncbi:MAG: hypothetical protein DGJ47_000929 [Rickettsiaceae bacterium]